MKCFPREMPRLSVPPADSLLFSQAWGVWWGHVGGGPQCSSAAPLPLRADLSPGEDVFWLISSPHGWLRRTSQGSCGWHGQCSPTPGKGSSLMKWRRASAETLSWPVGPAFRSTIVLVLSAGFESHSLNENDKFTSKGWLPSTRKGSALWASGPQGATPLSVGPAE